MIAVSVDSGRFCGVDSVKADPQLCLLRRDDLNRVCYSKEKNLPSVTKANGDMVTFTHGQRLTQIQNLFRLTLSADAMLNAPMLS